MSVVPGNLETDKQPPMTVPLRHFVVAIGFLFLGGVVGLANAFGIGSGLLPLAHVHLLLAGWVCITIMGAMTQFVPVWSGVTLHSRPLATVQLWIVGIGLVGFAVALTGGWLRLTPVFGTLMAIGFWVFVYNIARTLVTIDGRYDVTERHFAFALAFFVALTLLGVALAVDFVRPLFVPVGLSRVDVVSAHATLAIYGAVLTTVLGALYQLGTMFTQTDLHGIDTYLQRFEEVGYPIGVVALATGRLVGHVALARVGALLILGGIGCMSVVLARRLYETQVPWTPMLSRYTVAAAAMAAWVFATVPVWIIDPVAPTTRFGAPGATHLLGLGVIGFVVLGTIYHIVPFIVWVHHYSDRLGYEAVPMIDDLYDDRLAALDLGLLTIGGLALVIADWTTLSSLLAGFGGFLIGAGILVFGWNMGSVIRTHSPNGLVGVLVPDVSRGSSTDTTSEDPR
jgi:hypothetical protein